MARFKDLKPELKGILHTYHLHLHRYNHDIGNLYRSQVLDQLCEPPFELAVNDGRVLVATDGSLKVHSSLKTVATGACAYTIADSRLNRVARLPVLGSISILTAELVGLLAAITVANQEGFGRILIITDSKTACQKFLAFQQGAYSKLLADKLGTNPRERALWMQVGVEARQANVLIRHIRSHQRVDYSQIMLLNQKADTLAKTHMEQLLDEVRQEDGLPLVRH